MVWILVWIGAAVVLAWGHKRFWDRLKKTPHNSIKGLDYTDTE